MFGSSHFSRVHDLFVEQFEPDDHGWVYRKGNKGAPVRVSQAERDRFVTDFKRRLRYMSVLLIGLTFLLIVGLVAMLPERAGPNDEDPIAMIAVGLLIAGIWLPAFYWSWNAPGRALRRRPTVGNPLTAAEARSMALAKTTYGQFLGGIAMGGVLLLSSLNKEEPKTVWNILWIGFWCGIILLCHIQIYRKWRITRSTP